MNRPVKKHLAAAALLLVSAAAYAFYAALMIHFFGTSCPLKAFLGIPCPGCGMTRAIAAALQGNFAAAFEYHPLFALTPFLIGGIIWYAVRPSKKCGAALGVICAIFIIVYIIRLLTGWRG